jgi:hypothetical protein
MLRSPEYFFICSEGKLVSHASKLPITLELPLILYLLLESYNTNII